MRAAHDSDHLRSRRIFRSSWLRLCLIVSFGCLCWPLPAKTAPTEKLSEYDVEAAYLFNFSKFVTWPATSRARTDTLLICVLGNDPFGEVLDKIVAGEKINGAPVAEKKISSAEEAPACSILYVSNNEASRLGRILYVVKDLPVLTVSDIPDFLDRGGMIQFVLRDDRVRFAVNLAPAQRDGLIFSSELLKVAVTVKRAEGRH
jgi:hypothetical protein